MTINRHRSGAASNAYTIPNYDNSAAGSYTCMVTVSTVASSESSSYSLIATGILIFRAYLTCCLALRYVFINKISRKTLKLIILQLQHLLFLHQIVPPVMRLVELL